MDANKNLSSPAHSVLVVDDDTTNLRMLQEILRPFYKVYAAPSGKRALGFLENKIPDLVILDIEMPSMNGYDFIKKLKADFRFANIPVVFFTAQEGRDNEEEAFRLGAVDYILKPISTGVVCARVALHIGFESYRRRLEQMLDEKISQLTKVQESIARVMENVVFWRDNGAGGHIDRISAYAGIIVNGLAEKNDPEYTFDLTYREYIIRTARLHDVGKAAVPDSILLKPGELTPEEFAEMKKHTTYGAQMIDDAAKDIDELSQFMGTAREIVISHHECWNGSGYPNGLSGSDIPIAGRVVALACMYDSLTSGSFNKQALPHAEAVAIIRDEAGRRFDPRMISLLDGVFPLLAEVFGAR